MVCIHVNFTYVASKGRGKVQVIAVSSLLISVSYSCKETHFFVGHSYAWDFRESKLWKVRVIAVTSLLIFLSYSYEETRFFV
jgi:hypothetical protein